MPAASAVVRPAGAGGPRLGGSDAAAVAPTATATAALQEPPPYRLAWLVPSPEWTKTVAIAPWGDVVTYGSRTLRVHGRETGKVLAETGTCFTFPNSFGFVSERTGAMVCEDRINVFSFPGAKYRGVRKLTGHARAAAFGARVVAVADASGAVALFDTRDWHQQTTLPSVGKVSALGVSPDGMQIARGLEDGRIRIDPNGTGAPVELEARAGHAVTTLAFSPNGRRLFGSAGPTVAAWATADGTLVTTFRMVREVTAARWLSNEEIVVTGLDGLLVLRMTDGSARSVGDGGGAGHAPPLALDVSEDARMLCVGAPSGSVRCFLRGAERARQDGPVLEPTVAVRKESCAAGTPTLETMGGRVVSYAGDRLLLRAGAAAPPPKVGQCGRLLWHERRHEGELDRSLWRELGDVRIDDVRGDVVQLLVLDRATLPDGSVPAEGALPYDTPVRLQWAAR